MSLTYIKKYMSDICDGICDDICQVMYAMTCDNPKFKSHLQFESISSCLGKYLGQYLSDQNDERQNQNGKSGGHF